MEELMRNNLLHMINLEKLWEAAQARQTVPRTKEAPATLTIATAGPDDVKLQGLLEDLKEIAAAYLSREGRIVIEKGLQEAGGNQILYDDEKTAAFIKQLEKEARNIDSNARIDEMIDLMKSEIAGRMAV
jgi:precorrin-4 methylase